MTFRSFKPPPFLVELAKGAFYRIADDAQGDLKPFRWRRLDPLEPAAGVVEPTHLPEATHRADQGR